MKTNANTHNYRRPTRIRLEAECLDCGETFIPDSGDDVTHVVRDDGTDCGGSGVISARWSS